MSTIVRIRGRQARLTPQGWKTGDAQLDSLCDLAEEIAPFLWDPNPARAAASKLASVLDGQILSVEPQPADDLPAETVY